MARSKTGGHYLPTNYAGKSSTLLLSAIAASFIFLACASIGILRAGQAAAGSKTAQAATHGVVVANMDKTCKPCEDFYHYVNGTWLAKNPVPEAYPTWNSFSELAERNRQHLREILEAEAENPHAAARLE